MKTLGVGNSFYAPGLVELTFKKWLEYQRDLQAQCEPRQFYSDTLHGSKT